MPRTGGRPSRPEITCFDDCNEQEKIFVLTYISNGFNATDAYEVTHPNCPKNCNANGTASRYRKRLDAAIADKITERCAELQITADHVLWQLAEMAFAAKEDEIYNSQVKLKAIDLMQKQMGLQTKNVKAEAEVSAAVTFVDDLKPDENQSN